MDEDRKDKLRALTQKEVEDLLNALKNGLDLGISKGGFAIEEVAQVRQFLYGFVRFVNKALFSSEDDSKDPPVSPEDARTFLNGLYAAIQKASKNGGYTLDIGTSIYNVFETLKQLYEVHLEDSK